MEFCLQVKCKSLRLFSQIFLDFDLTTESDRVERQTDRQIVTWYMMKHASMELFIGNVLSQVYVFLNRACQIDSE